MDEGTRRTYYRVESRSLIKISLLFLIISMSPSLLCLNVTCVRLGYSGKVELKGRAEV